MVNVPLTVRDLMAGTVLSLRPDDTVEAAWQLMVQRRLRHMVVVDADGDLVGLVSRRDLLTGDRGEGAALPAPAPVRVEEVMTSEVETVEPAQSLAEAAQLMFENGFGCLPVVEGPHLVGLLTEADFVRWFAHEAGEARPDPRTG